MRKGGKRNGFLSIRGIQNDIKERENKRQEERRGRNEKWKRQGGTKKGGKECWKECYIVSIEAFLPGTG